MSGWDDDDFEPPEASATLVPRDKWDGEDSDDDVKDSWDKESDEDKSKTETSEEAKERAIAKKKKKKLAEIIAEKEEKRLAELEALALKKAEQDRMNTAEGKLEEKMRLQKIEEKANLELAKEMLGLQVKGGGIDASLPETKEQFDDLEKMIGDKLQTLVGSEHYNDFGEKLVKRICLELNVATLKKVKMQVEALHSAKLKDEKATKSKKPKGRTTVKMDLDKDLLSGGVGDYDDMDDFM